MSGGGSSPAPAPSTTTSIQDVPAWEQGYLTNLLGQAQTIAAQPYQQFPGQQVAGFTDNQNQAFNNVANLNSTFQPTQNAGAASAQNGANTANGIYNAGAPYAQAAALAASPQGISAFMSPYTDSVVNGITNQANMNWNNKIMPGVNDAFVGSGQFGSGRNAQVLGQAANDFQTNLSANVANALQSGYNTAGNQAATEASTLLNTGTTLGNLQATQGQQQTAAGTALSNIGTQQLQNNLTSDQALQAVGQQQQQQNQNNLNVAQQNWQNEVNYPMQQTEYLSGIIRGLPAMGSAVTSSSQTSPQGIYTPSPLSGIGGAGASALSLMGNNGQQLGTATLKTGGLVKGYAAGGQVDDPYGNNDYGEEEPMALSNMVLPNGQSDSAPASGGDGQDFLSALLAGKQAAPSSVATPPTPAAAIAEKANPLAALNKLKAPQLDDSQIQRAQLLSIARGMLSPTRTGSSWESLGNAIGGAEDTGLQAAKWNAEMQQKMIAPQLEKERLGVESRHWDNMASAQQARTDEMTRHNTAIEAMRAASGTGTGGNSAATQKYNMWLTVHPDDTEGALKYASGTKIQDDEALNKTAVTLASKDQLGIDEDGTMKPQEKVNAYKTYLKTGAFPEKVVAKKPPGFFSKIFGSGDDADKPETTPDAMTALPDASEHVGRIVKDTSTGKRFKSDGKTWNPM